MSGVPVVTMPGPSFIVPGPPACKGSVVSFPDKRGVIRTKTDNKRLKSWAKNVAWCAKTAGVQFIPKGSGVYICVAFEFAPPARRTRALPCVRPDIDKLQRALLDALTGIAYEDDGQVVDVHAWKSYADVTQTRVWVSPA